MQPKFNMAMHHALFEMYASDQVLPCFLRGFGRSLCLGSLAPERLITFCKSELHPAGPIKEELVTLWDSRRRQGSTARIATVTPSGSQRFLPSYITKERPTFLGDTHVIGVMHQDACPGWMVKNSTHVSLNIHSPFSPLTFGREVGGIKTCLCPSSQVLGTHHVS